MVMQLMPPINQQQQSRLVPMQELMRDIRRDTPTSNLEALRYLQTMSQQNPTALMQPMSYMNQGGLVSLPVVYRGWGGIGSALGGITRGIGRIVKGAGSAVSDVGKGISGALRSLTGGEGSGDLLKTIALMALTSYLLPAGQIMNPYLRAAYRFGKGAFIPAIASEGIRGVTKDPLSTDKLIRGGLSAGIGAISDQFNPPRGYTGTEDAGTGEAVAEATDVAGDQSYGQLQYKGGFAEGLPKGPALSQTAGDLYGAAGADVAYIPDTSPIIGTSTVHGMSPPPTILGNETLGQAWDYAKNIPKTVIAEKGDIPGISGLSVDYTATDLAKDAAASYAAVETDKAMREQQLAQDTAQEEADRLYDLYQAGEREKADRDQMRQDDLRHTTTIARNRRQTASETAEDIMAVEEQAARREESAAVSEEEQHRRAQQSVVGKEADRLYDLYQAGEREIDYFVDQVENNPLFWEKVRRPKETLAQTTARMQQGDPDYGGHYEKGSYYRIDPVTGEKIYEARYGGGLRELQRRAGGPAFFEGRVPNTVDPRSDGMSDSETMLITNPRGTQPTGIMKISEDEYVMSAPDMAILGNGSPQAGAQVMDKFRQDLRTAAYGTQAHQPRINQQQALQSLTHRAFG